MARITVIVVNGRSIERRRGKRGRGRGERGERPDAAKNSAEKAGKGFPERIELAASFNTDGRDGHSLPAAMRTTASFAAESESRKRPFEIRCRY